jgi:hypothetical protein
MDFWNKWRYEYETSKFSVWLHQAVGALLILCQVCPNRSGGTCLSLPLHLHNFSEREHENAHHCTVFNNMGCLFCCNSVDLSVIGADS